MTFHEDWFSDAACDALAELCRMTEHLAGDVVEVGCWEGKSTIALANAAHPAMVHAVDTWEGSPGEVSEELAAKRDVYATFEANIREATKGNVCPHRMDWRDYFADNDAPLRFCFIDATHSYREVRDNIAAALRLLVPGGIICGDDQHHPPVRRAVVEQLPGALTVGPIWFWQKPSSLAAEYERRCNTVSDIYLHLARFVEMVTDCNAKHVIELGTRSGVSTVAWLYGLEQTGGRLTSVDLDPQPEIGSWGHWRFIQGDDLDGAVLADLDDADIVFIDTSHTYEHTLTELRVYQHLVRRPGLIVCHDTEVEYPIGAPPRPRFPVRTAIEEFVADEGYEWQNFPECNGLGVITVR